MKLAAVLLVALLALSGCIRSVLGASEAFFLLAGKKIIASAPIAPSNRAGAAEGTTNVSNIGQPDLVFAALDELVLTQNRLRALPVQEVSAATLLTAPVPPGFYHVSGSLNILSGASLHLTGDGLHVFNLDGMLNLEAGASIQADSNVQSANVFWNTPRSATLGAASQFIGILVSEGDITVGANALVQGKLLSRAGNLVLNSTQITDTTVSLNAPPALSVPANVYQVAPGQTLSFQVTADLLDSIGRVGIFSKNLPAGAVMSPNTGGTDTTGPNGSDLLNIALVTPIGGEAKSTFTWTPTTPGTYRVNFLARAKAGIGSANSAAALRSAIDITTVTIQVGYGRPAAGIAAANGTFGSGVFAGTFTMAVSSRGTGINAPATGTLRFTTTSPRLNLKSTSIQSVQVTDLPDGGKAATILGFVLVPNFGQVPFTATAIQSGRATEPDVMRITLGADLRNNGSPATTFGGPVYRRGGTVVIR
jgi:hypothetical protein